VAGTNMAGGAATFDDSTVMNSLKYFGMSLVSAGEINVEGASGYEVLRKLDFDADHGKGAYRKIVLKDNRIVGFVFAGQIERSGVFNGLLKRHVDVSAIKGLLLKDDFDLIDLPAEMRRNRYNDSSAGVARQPSWVAEAHVPASHLNGGMHGGH
jgi:NAD(P)H-nitrite reductase large subunit